MSALPAPHILIVCTGNICRSPLAEQLLRAKLLAAGVDVTVSSAGTQAMVGGAMTPEAHDLSLQLGSVTAEHTPRQLTAQMLANADLVLTATRDHRRDAVTLFPRATRYTFTLNQFARLVDAAAAESAAAAADPALSEPHPFPADPPAVSAFADFVAAIAATRGMQPSPTPPTLDDIEDPYRRSATVYAQVAAVIDGSVTAVAAALSTALVPR